ncbi:glycosyltransferase family 4 protein [Akkermansiaceae bacterium]|nr:glycosyltransferase family 4 protein [Akkermansiaceae bacterium]
MAGKSILLVADPYLRVPPPTYGGVERIVDILAEGLAKRGWDVTLACHPESTCRVKILPLPSLELTSKGRSVNAVKLLVHSIRHRYDIVHTSAHFDLTALMWPLSQKIIQTFHALPDREPFAKRLRFIPRRNLWFTTVGKHMVPALEHIAPTTAIHNAIKVTEFTFQGGVKPDAPLVFLGRIEEIKGTHTAIRIAKECGRKLVIAGNRSTNPDIDRFFMEKVEPHLSEQITYIGPVGAAEKNKLLGEAAAFLMPIEWDEPFGLVMVEALACGTPVIAIARGAVPEIVEDGVTGVCCNSTEEMIQAVKSIGILSRQACRKTAENLFSPETMVDNYEKFYDKVLS